MKLLVEFLKNNQAIYKPASTTEISDAENELGLVFDKDYKEYLSQIGLFSYEYIETYGLGVPRQNYLNIIEIAQKLRPESGFQSSFLPLLNIGDGHYYVYDNTSKSIKVWASPNGGVAEEICQPLEDFLLNLLQDI